MIEITNGVAREYELVDGEWVLKAGSPWNEGIEPRPTQETDPRMSECSSKRETNGYGVLPCGCPVRRGEQFHWCGLPSPEPSAQETDPE